MTVAVIKKTIRRGIGTVAPAVWRIRRRPSLVILGYHRVLPIDHPDRRVEQPGMFVSPETLVMHLRVLKEHFDVVDLGEWLRCRAEGRSLPRRACSITFDDGWRDNYEHGFPILKTAAVPATIFLVSDFIGGRYEFWPNRLARLLAAFSADSSNAMPSQLKDLVSRAGLQRKIDCRAEIGNEEIDRAISVCKALPDVVMNRILDEAEGSMNKTATAGIRSLLDQAEIREMSHSGLVAFGSHTCRHVRLMDCLEEETIRREVRESRVDLEGILGRPVDLFCYPNGDYCDKAVAFVRETYAAAVTVNPGWNSLRSNPHLLRRVSVHEDVTKDALSFAARITGLV